MNTDLGSRFGKRKLGALLVAAAALGALAWYVKNHVTLDELVAHETQVREAIALNPLRAFAIGFLTYAGFSLVPGTSGKSIIFGWLFGFWQGVLIIILGLTAAATVIFYLSRYAFRSWIETRYERFLTALNRHLQKEGAFYLLTLRMAHFPYTILNYASGASRVRIETFWWTTALGLLPGTMVFAYVGVRLPSLRELASEGAGSLIDPLIVVALAASAVFPLLFRWSARRLGLMKSSAASLEEERQLLKDHD
jgi:uncharacterized membrane protein YdjX (TVP38/TMEM64 family)